jgi:hypothetical protein
LEGVQGVAERLVAVQRRQRDEVAERDGGAEQQQRAQEGAGLGVFGQQQPGGPERQQEDQVGDGPAAAVATCWRRRGKNRTSSTSQYR